MALPTPAFHMPWETLWTLSCSQLVNKLFKASLHSNSTSTYCVLVLLRWCSYTDFRGLVVLISFNSMQLYFRELCLAQPFPCKWMSTASCFISFGFDLQLNLITSKCNWRPSELYCFEYFHQSAVRSGFLDHIYFKTPSIRKRKSWQWGFDLWFLKCSSW